MQALLHPCLYCGHLLPILTMPMLSLVLLRFLSLGSSFLAYQVVAGATAAKDVCRHFYCFCHCLLLQLMLSCFCFQPHRALSLLFLSKLCQSSTPEESGRACRQCWEISATLGHDEEHPHGDKLGTTIGKNAATY